MLAFRVLGRSAPTAADQADFASLQRKLADQWKLIATHSAEEQSVVVVPSLSMGLELASGMSAPHRLQDLADVLRLISVAKLPRELGEKLDAYVRAKYEELWQTAQRPDDDY